MFKKVIFTVLIFTISIVATGCSNDVESAEDQENILSGPNESNWDVSPLFNSDGYTMIGEEGRIGFIYDDSEVVRFYPDKVNKYMWHFWGKDEEFDEPLKITATHKKNGGEIILFEDLPVSGANNGADRHLPSNFSLPDSGKWRLDAFFGNEFFGSIIVEVYED